MMVGGTLSPETISTDGSDERSATSTILSSTSYSWARIPSNRNSGFLDISVEIARVKLAMIRIARQVVLVADSMKYAQRALAKVAPLSSVHTLRHRHRAGRTSRSSSAGVRSRSSPGVTRFRLRLLSLSFASPATAPVVTLAGSESPGSQSHDRDIDSRTPLRR